MVEGLLSSVEARKGGSSTALLELENVLKACPPTTYLIFTENIKLRSTGKMIKLIQQFAEIKEFELPRGREVNGWIKNRLVKLNGKATEGNKRIVGNPRFQYHHFSNESNLGQHQNACFHS